MKSFKLYFDEHRADNLVCEVEFIEDGKTPIIQWYEEVFIGVPTITKYYGEKAEQPKFVIFGKYDKLSLQDHKLTIT